MIPILYGSDEDNFTSNGLGRLADAISCKVTEERNGIYELEMEYPVGGRHFGQLLLSNIIYCRASQDNKMQAFRIYDVTDAIDGVSTVRAQHISYQLTAIPVEPFAASTPSDAVGYLSSKSVVTNPFTIDTDIDDGGFEIITPDSVRAIIGGIDGNMLLAWGAEVEWDMYDVHILQSRGENRGKVVRYGKNITDITQEQNIEETVTGIYPYYSDSDGNYIDLTEKVLLAPTASLYPYLRITPLDLSGNFAGVPTEAELRVKAQEYMSKVSLGIPRVSIDVSYIDDTDHSTPVYLCDIVTVIFEKLGISTSAKVSKVEWNVLLDRYESITAGIEFDSVADAIVSSEERAKASSMRNTTRQVREATKKITQETDAKLVDVMYVYVRPNEITTNAITNGNTGSYLVFDFELDADQEIVELHISAMMSFDNITSPCGTVEITLELDEQTIDTWEMSYCEAVDGSDTLLQYNRLLEDIEEGNHQLIVKLTAIDLDITPNDGYNDAWIFARKITKVIPPNPKQQFIDELVDRVRRAGIAQDKSIITSAFYIDIPAQLGLHRYSSNDVYRWIKSDPSATNGLTDDSTDIATALLVGSDYKTYRNSQGVTVQVPYEYYKRFPGHRFSKTVEAQVYTPGEEPTSWSGLDHQVQMYRSSFRVPPEGAQALTTSYQEYYGIEYSTNIPIFETQADAEAYAAAVQATYDDPTTEHANALSSLLSQTIIWDN